MACSIQGILLLSVVVVSGGSRILKRGGGGAMIRILDVGEGRSLRAEFALSTVAIVSY